MTATETIEQDPRRLVNDPVAAARTMLLAAEWAGEQFAGYDRAAVARIVEAAARAGFAEAERYAEWAVRETGFGVAEHKKTKNEIASLGIAEHYRAEDFVTPRVDPERRIAEIPRPAGVILALTPSTNPISTLYFKTLLALMTRNAIVISPHPLSRECCVAACRTVADAAVSAGAPADVIQIVEEPSVPLVQELMADPHVNVIVATGGAGVVRAAHRSGNPAIGVGPGNAPVVVDDGADVRAAARHLVDSKAFDNSLLCSSESVLIVESGATRALQAEMRKAGAHFCSAEERDRLRALLFPNGTLNVKVVGQSAAWVARELGLRVGPGTRALVAPIDVVLSEEWLAHEKMCPVLAFAEQPDFAGVVRAAQATLRIAGAGHSAAIHSTDPARVMAYARAVRVLRVVVNAPTSTGVAGFDTNLAPTMTVGTGFVGGSSLGENLGPRHLVNMSRIAYTKDESVPFPDAETWLSPDPLGKPPAHELNGELREQIRAMVLEELTELTSVS